MKKSLLIFIYYFMCNIAFGQSYQDTSKIKVFFSKKYEKKIYKIFEGKIRKESNETFLFNDKKVLVWSKSTELRILLEEGIIYPEILCEYNMLENTKVMKFSIDGFEEITIFGKKSNSKRFQFLLYKPNMMKPIVCFIEIINEYANEKTSNESFLRNSRLTFFKEGWIM